MYTYLNPPASYNWNLKMAQAIFLLIESTTIHVFVAHSQHIL